MLTFSKVLDINDYSHFTEHLAIEPIIRTLKRNYRYEHEHRKWEYGMALRFLLQNNVKTVLDVGGGGSIFSPLLSMYGFEVTQLDAGYGEKEVEYQNQFLKNKIKFTYGDFSKDQKLGKYDAVVSISTIEHVENDEDFFNNLLKHSKNLVFFTTDFHPSGKPFSGAHLRTYNKDSLAKLVFNSKNVTFRFPNLVLPTFVYTGDYVYDYSFASVALVKYDCEQ